MRSRLAVVSFTLLLSCRNNDLTLTNLTLVDPSTATRRPNMTVVIRDEKIIEVRPTRAGEGGGASGGFLIPGLWDMHAHVWDPDRELPMLVANGVLGVRDVGNNAKRIFRLREDVKSGLLGPQIVACGSILDGPEPTNRPISIAVKDGQGGREAVRSLKELGADCIKVHDGVPLDAYLAIADEARAAGLPLVGHVPVAVPTLDATNAGQRSIEHQIGLRGTSTAEDEVMQLEATHDVMAEAMATGNFSLIPENIARKGNLLLDRFDAQRAQELYRAFAKNGTYLDPTLVTQYALTYIDDLSKREDARMKYMPASTTDYWRPEKGMLTRYRTPAYIAFRKRELAKTFEQIPVAQRAGVKFLAGTDMSIAYVYPGFSLHDELALFVQAGLTPAEALQTATTNPARFLGLEASVGSIAAGKRADLVLLDADPLADIANTKKIRAVIVRGKLLDRAALDQLLRDAERAAAPK